MGKRKHLHFTLQHKHIVTKNINVIMTAKVGYFSLILESISTTIMSDINPVDHITMHQGEHLFRLPNPVETEGSVSHERWKEVSVKFHCVILDEVLETLADHHKSIFINVKLHCKSTRTYSLFIRSQRRYASYKSTLSSYRDPPLAFITNSLVLPTPNMFPIGCQSRLIKKKNLEGTRVLIPIAPQKKE